MVEVENATVLVPVQYDTVPVLYLVQVHCTCTGKVIPFSRKSTVRGAVAVRVETTSYGSSTHHRISLSLATLFLSPNLSFLVCFGHTFILLVLVV